MNEDRNFPNLNGESEKDDDTPSIWTTAAERQTNRFAAFPEIYKSTLERLAVELALGMDEPQEIFTRYGYSPDQAMALLDSPTFTVLLARIGSEVKESGLSFRSKAKAIAEESLTHAYDLITDPLQSAAVRADLIKWSAKMAGHEPTTGKGDGGGGSGGFTLAISFSGQPAQTIISGREPITIENGATP